MVRGDGKQYDAVEPPRIGGNDPDRASDRAGETWTEFPADPDVRTEMGIPDPGIVANLLWAFEYVRRPSSSPGWTMGLFVSGKWPTTSWTTLGRWFGAVALSFFVLPLPLAIGYPVTLVRASASGEARSLPGFFSDFFVHFRRGVPAVGILTPLVALDVAILANVGRAAGTVAALASFYVAPLLLVVYAATDDPLAVFDVETVVGGLLDTRYVKAFLVTSGLLLLGSIVVVLSMFVLVVVVGPLLFATIAAFLGSYYGRDLFEENA